MNRPERMSRRSGYELVILNDVARTLNASVDLSMLLTRALEKVSELLGLETGWVLLFDEDSGNPYLAAAQNLPPGLDREPGRMAGWCFCLESYCQGRLPDAVNVGVVACSRLRKLALAQGNTAGLRYHASIPLKVYDDGTELQGDSESQAYARTPNDEDAPKEGNPINHRAARLKRIGMLNVASPEWRELTDDELSLLHTIGDVLGVAIERARLHARRLEAVQTEERNRIARDIHDTIAQDFSAIAFRLETAEALLDSPEDVERVRDSITAALDLTRKGLEEARRSVLDLRAAPLGGRTLPAALAALASEADATNAPTVHLEIVSTNAPTVHLEAVPPPAELAPAVEIGLYRVAQEALRNAILHAEAGTIRIRLNVSPAFVILTVEDDGRGFQLAENAERRASGRFGLIGMGERVRLLGGTFDIESTTGAGTRVTAKVPIDGR